MCGCGMLIECEVKTGQTVESIENTRREGGKTVVEQMCMEHENGGEKEMRGRCGIK